MAAWAGPVDQENVSQRTSFWDSFWGRQAAPKSGRGTPWPIILVPSPPYWHPGGPKTSPKHWSTGTRFPDPLSGPRQPTITPPVPMGTTWQPLAPAAICATRQPRAGSGSTTVCNVASRVIWVPLGGPDFGPACEIGCHKIGVTRPMSQDRCHTATVTRPLLQHRCLRTVVPRPLSQDRCHKAAAMRPLS